MNRWLFHWFQVVLWSALCWFWMCSVNCICHVGLRTKAYQCIASDQLEDAKNVCLIRNLVRCRKSGVWISNDMTNLSNNCSECAVSVWKVNEQCQYCICTEEYSHQYQQTSRAEPSRADIYFGQWMENSTIQQIEFNSLQIGNHNGSHSFKCLNLFVKLLKFFGLLKFHLSSYSFERYWIH